MQTPTRYIILQDASLFVRPNMRRNGFDIKLRNRLGVKFFTEAEFYARPGAQGEVEENIVPVNNVENPVQDEVFDEAIPIAMAMDNEPQNQQNEMVVQEINVNPDERLIIQNDQIIIEQINQVEPEAAVA